MPDLGGIGSRVEGYFAAFPSFEWGGFGALDFAPMLPPWGPAPLPWDMGAGVGRSFFGSGLWGDPLGFMFPDRLGYDVANAGYRLLGWGNILEVDPFWRDSFGTWPWLPFPMFPFGNPFAPSASTASTEAPASSAPTSSPTAVSRPETLSAPDHSQAGGSQAGNEPPPGNGKAEADDKGKTVAAPPLVPAGAGKGEAAGGKPKAQKDKALDERRRGVENAANQTGLAINLPGGIDKGSLDEKDIPEKILKKVEGDLYPFTDPKFLSGGRVEKVYVWIDKKKNVHKIYKAKDGSWQTRSHVGHIRDGVIYLVPSF